MDVTTAEHLQILSGADSNTDFSSEAGVPSQWFDCTCFEMELLGEYNILQFCPPSASVSQ
jgi:hypothetical protein